jgi:hypothetical protein
MAAIFNVSCGDGFAVQELEEKVRKLEHLLALKDERIQAMLTLLQASHGNAN